MALRNQPYFPLYVQDYLTDEKLNMCEWSSIGIYSKIMCVLHKQDDYGSILFKQNSKQNLSMIENFASILVKHIPCQLVDMINALNDLIDNGVLNIEDNKLFQKRMVKDGQISLKRSLAGLNGGGNPNLFKQTSKQKVKQTSKQITEYEDVIEINNEYKNGFLDVWNIYPTNRREKKKDCYKYWKQIPDEKIETFYNKTNKYVEVNNKDDYKFLKMSSRWFRDWETSLEYNAKSENDRVDEFRNIWSIEKNEGDVIDV